MAEYTGKIEISPSQRSDKSLSYYAVDNIEIKSTDWTHNITDDVYTYEIDSLQKPTVSEIRDADTKKTVMVDVDYLDDNKIRLSSIYNDHLIITVIYNLVPANLSDADIFYPATKDKAVTFTDGETLEMKYLNGDLTKFSQTNPNLSSIRYVKQIKEDTFIENKGKYSIVIYGSEHKLGLNVVVSVIMKQDPDTKVYTQINDGVISIDNNKTYTEGTTVIITFNSKFTGFIVLQKEKFTV